MTELVSASRLPVARWPASAKSPLVMAQQAVVGQILRSGAEGSCVIGVNGPPGTGKTTLLCDVIANVIVERARRLLEFDAPVNVFDNSLQIAGKKVSLLKSNIVAGTSIVVASANNNAVKNITQELPARSKVSSEFGEISYFPEAMNEVFTQQKVCGDDRGPIATWGLIAAALGNAGNRRAFANGFFRDEYVQSKGSNAADASSEEKVSPSSSKNAGVGQFEGAKGSTTLRQLLEVAAAKREEYVASWKRAKRSLSELINEFEEKRAVLLSRTRSDGFDQESREARRPP